MFLPSKPLLSAFYKTLPSKNPSKNLVFTEKTPYKRLLRTLPRSVRLHDPLGVHPALWPLHLQMGFATTEPKNAVVSRISAHCARKSAFRVLSVLSSVCPFVSLSVFSLGSGLPLVPVEKAAVAASQSQSVFFGAPRVSSPPGPRKPCDFRGEDRPRCGLAGDGDVCDKTCAAICDCDIWCSQGSTCSKLSLKCNTPTLGFSAPATGVI